MVEPQKQATSGLQKKQGESSAHAQHILSKQNGRTVPSESERSIENLARVPSMQTVDFCCAPATQYAADAKAVKKMTSIPSIQMTVLHNASATQNTASQKAALKEIARVPSMQTLDFFIVPGSAACNSTQLTQ